MRSVRRHWVAVFVGLILCAGLLAAQNSAPVPVQDPNFKLSVSTQLVNVTVTVLDERSAYVDGLKQEDFQIFEDGVEQKVSFFSHDRRIPVSVGVLVDISGSMRHKLQQALQTAREVSLALSDQDEMFLVTFNSDVEMRQRLTRDKSLLDRSLQGIRTSGDTSLYDAIQMGLGEMKSAHNAKKIIVLISDGFDSKSTLKRPEAEEMLKRAEVEVYTIGIDDDENDKLVVVQPLYHMYHDMLNSLASISGGRVFRLFTGRNYQLDALAKLLMEELHQQYLLSFYPASTTSAAFRKLEVKVAQPRATTRHRTGYYLTQQPITEGR